MMSTGAGLHGIDHSNYQSWVVDKVCKYYNELMPVLGSRPNVSPIFTNEDEVESKNKTNHQSSNDCYNDDDDDDDESLFNNLNQHINNKDSTKSVIEIDDDECINTTRRSSGGVGLQDYVSISSPSKNTNSNFSSLSQTQTCSSTSFRSPVTEITVPTKASPPKKQKTAYNDKPLTPIEAKRIQHNLLRKHKLQIHGKKKEVKNLGLMTDESNDRDFLMSCRKEKIQFEKEKHDYEKAMKKEEITISKEKINIEKARLEIERKKEALIEKKIEGEIAFNDKKTMLLRLEMFKEREALKKANPDLTDEYLDARFPF
jgi:hypothetical protein